MNKPNITTEDRAARIFETFLAEHEVLRELHEDLMEEIILAISCYCDSEEGDNDSPIRQSELYDYMEEYLVKWVGDLADSRLPSITDVIHWGYWPESFAKDVRQYGDSTAALVQIHIRVGG